MLRLFFGENDFALGRETQRLVAEFTESEGDGAAQQFDGEKLSKEDFLQIIKSEGASLFFSSQLIIIKNLSENKSLWEKLPDFLPTSANVNIILLEKLVDKRTKTYKALAKHEQIKEFKDLDSRAALLWLKDEAKGRKVSLGRGIAEEIIKREGVNLWNLSSLLDKLEALGRPVELNELDFYVAKDTTANVFSLFEVAMKGRLAEAWHLVDNLRLTNDPHQTLGLLSSQAFNLASLVLLSASYSDVAKIIKANPYALKNLNSLAQKTPLKKAKASVQILVEADVALKTSKGEPWEVIKLALAKLAHL